MAFETMAFETMAFETLGFRDLGNLADRSTIRLASIAAPYAQD
jgi:hypothetical protein